MAKPTQAEQIAALAAQVQTVVARLDHLERERLQPLRWPWERATPPLPITSVRTPFAAIANEDFTFLAAMFHYFTAALLTLIRGYYLGFGMLYTLAGGAGLITTLTHPSNIPPRALTLVIDLLVLLIGLSNLSCLRVRAERWQRGVAIPTIFTAGLLLVVATVTAILLHSPLNAGVEFLLWSTFLLIHVGLLRHLSGRIGLRQFTEGFAAFAERQSEASP